MSLKKVQNIIKMIIKIKKVLLMKKKKQPMNFKEVKKMKMICNNGEEKICQMK